MDWDGGFADKKLYLILLLIEKVFDFHHIFLTYEGWCLLRDCKIGDDFIKNRLLYTTSFKL